VSKDVESIFKTWACARRRKRDKNPYFAIDWESIRDSANNKRRWSTNKQTNKQTHTHTHTHSTSEIDRDRCIDTTSLADTTYLFFREREVWRLFWLLSALTPLYDIVVHRALVAHWTWYDGENNIARIAADGSPAGCERS